MKSLFKLVLGAVILCAGLGLILNGVQAHAEKTIAVRASHILVDTKEEAQSIQQRLANGISFEYLAQKYSKCPSSQKGGDLGFFRRGQMVKEFEKAAFSMEPGQISEPIQTQFGWHLIKVTDKK